MIIPLACLFAQCQNILLFQWFTLCQLFNPSIHLRIAVQKIRSSHRSSKKKKPTFFFFVDFEINKKKNKKKKKRKEKALTTKGRQYFVHFVVLNCTRQMHILFWKN
jgi:hypothetical protein